MIIAKFGGTSVSSAKSIRTICEITKSNQDKGIIIVVSALSKVTDALLTAANSKGKEQTEVLAFIRKVHADLITEMFKVDGNVHNDMLLYIEKCLGEVKELLKTKQMDKEQRDVAISYGEIMSSFIIAETLKLFGIKAEQVIASNFIITDDNFGSAEPLFAVTQKKTKEELLPIIVQKIV